MKTKFFTFKQNNSGGSFDHEPENGVGYAVSVEAKDWRQANKRAVAIGLYFDGVDKGMDCDCCGDRWYPQSVDDKGDDRPELYGKPIKSGWGIPSYIHHLDGRVEEVA